MRSTQVHIDLDALEWNFECIRKHAPTQKVLGLVKANAYGHGIVPIARALEMLGVDMLGVALLDEAIELRRCGVTCDILILTPIETHEAALAVEHNVHIVACSLPQSEAISNAARAAGVKVSMHLYIDTGMLREGFRPADAVAAAQHIAAMPGADLVGVCTHFATADDPHSPFLRSQLESFTQVLTKLDNAGYAFEYVHAANSGALWMEKQAHFTLVRTGLALYGYALGAEPYAALRPVMSVRSTINSFRHAWPGESVSYGQRYIVAAEATIATIPIGYGDGYMRSLSGKGQCLISGKRYPIVGSICMDELMVNIGTDTCSLDQDVVVLGGQIAPDGSYEYIDAIEIAERAGTIPYEVMTAFSARVPRVYNGRIATEIDLQGLRD
ncbi:MAG: alanine racemase [Ignavibacteria bacterium]|jgi:alanine racemase